MHQSWPRQILLICLTLASLLAFARPEPAVNSQVGTIFIADLPHEARQTLRLIQRGGPYPYERDGVEFRNFERRLPKAARGHYREYTVSTPGLNHRGARRIVSAGDPPTDYYYTEDHYNSFRRIQE